MSYSTELKFRITHYRIQCILLHAATRAHTHAHWTLLYTCIRDSTRSRFCLVSQDYFLVLLSSYLLGQYICGATSLWPWVTLECCPQLIQLLGLNTDLDWLYQDATELYIKLYLHTFYLRCVCVCARSFVSVFARVWLRQCSFIIYCFPNWIKKKSGEKTNICCFHLS